MKKKQMLKNLKAINKILEHTKEEPQMRLYGLFADYSTTIFDQKEYLIDYITKHDMNSMVCHEIYVLDYLGNVAGRLDVIRKTNSEGHTHLYTAIDRDGYGIYNRELSIRDGKFIWEYNEGSIEFMYDAFRRRGIVFERDVYAEIEKEEEERIQFMKEYWHKRQKATK